ncbi:MAG: U32 family peptidase [Clostridia bacterium]|nr:U32 family peptidase [Clostridia bacterium]
MTNILKPEILAPAGDFERLEAAVEYGADAVYLGSDCFGMRTAAASFGGDNLKKACKYAHSKGVKVYLTCNTVPRNNELSMLPDFLKYAANCGVDAFIITDIGVMGFAKKYAPDVEIHISTQAGITNYAAANAFYEMGAKRIVTARELSLEEIIEIRKNTPSDLEIECFVHGAMCVSFSGRCLLSNYMTGRDSNRGDCAQPCRWRYSLVEEKRPGEYFPIEQDNTGTYVMNSRDMCLIEHIPELVKAGINSFKIEGRAKSAYYTAVSVNAYRCATDSYAESGFSDEWKPEQWIIDEVRKASNRQYCTGFYFSTPMDDAQIFYNGGYVREWDVAAITEKWENGILYASQRNRFFEGDELEVMIKGKKPIKVTVENLKNEDGEKVDNAPHPMMKFTIDCSVEIPVGSYLRMERKNGVIL